MDFTALVANNFDLENDREKIWLILVHYELVKTKIMNISGTSCSVEINLCFCVVMVWVLDRKLVWKAKGQNWRN